MLNTTALSAMRRIAKIATAPHGDEKLRLACVRAMEPTSPTDSVVALEVLASWPDSPLVTHAVREFCREASRELRSEMNDFRDVSSPSVTPLRV